MKLLFERSKPGRRAALVPPCDVPEVPFDASMLRGAAPRLPEIAEVDLGRHYTELMKQTHGVNINQILTPTHKLFEIFIFFHHIIIFLFP